MKLQEGENTIHEIRPEPSILRIWFFTKCLFPALMGTFASFVSFAFFGAMFAHANNSDSGLSLAAGGIAALIAGPVILVLGLVYCSFLRKTYLYYITNQRCVFHGGILRRIERSIPYHKITDVEMSQNIIERILGISTLKIFTPGTGSMMVSPFGGQRAELCFVGLKDNETPASTINEILRKFKSTGE